MKKAIAYVDGSYNCNSNIYGYGAVIFYEGKVYEYLDSDNNHKLRKMRNIAGELMGATFIINWCLNRKISELDLYYDYLGIEKWATGEWKANKGGTKSYAFLCYNSRKQLKINFIKVKAHSGEKYNEMADLLAKEAVGL